MSFLRTLSGIFVVSQPTVLGFNLERLAHASHVPEQSVTSMSGQYINASPSDTRAGKLEPTQAARPTERERISASKVTREAYAMPTSAHPQSLPDQLRETTPARLARPQVTNTA